MTAAAIALTAALLFAIGSVLQQRAASEIPDDQASGAGFIMGLLRRPIWLLGTVADTSGFVVQGVALAFGSLVLVQPLLATSLLFALPLGAWINKRRLRRSDIAWAVLLTIGLTVFLVAGEPTEGVDTAPVRDWLIASAVIVPITVGAVVVAGRRRSWRAVGLAIATGILFGLTAALVKSAVSYLDDGVVGFLSQWEPYAMVAAAGLGTYLQQASYQAGSLAQTLPAVAVLEPVVGVALGVGILQEDLQAQAGEWVLIALSAVAMVLSTAFLARAQGAAEESATAAAPGVA
ncbi:MAG: DMT family transporter [Thermoleophilia bacterium]